MVRDLYHQVRKTLGGFAMPSQSRGCARIVSHGDESGVMKDTRIIHGYGNEGHITCKRPIEFYI